MKEQHIGQVLELDRKTESALIRVYDTKNETPQDVEVHKEDFEKSDWHKVRRDSVVTVTLFQDKEKRIHCNVALGRKPLTEKEKSKLKAIEEKLK